MEELGIGRPSTYASTLNVLRERDYVRIDKKRLYPEDKGRLVTAFLESFFSRYVEYDFTADLEEKLDLISAGKLEWKDVLRDFWREFIGAVNDIGDLRITQVLDALNDLLGPHIFPAQGTGGDPRACPSCNAGRLSLKVGKFGAFIGCSNYPDCRFTRQLADTGDKATALAEAKVLGTDPETGLDVTLRTGRFGPYVQLGEAEWRREAETRLDPEGHRPRQRRLRLTRSSCCRCRARSGCIPRRASRSWRASAASGPTSSTTANMPASAHLRRCSRSASIAPSAFSPRRRRRRASRAAPASSRSSASTPTQGGKVQVLTGRYGPYVKHGKVNATLPKDREPEQVTMDEAVALIAARERQGLRPRRSRPRSRHARAQRATKRPSRRRQAERRPWRNLRGLPPSATKTVGKLPSKQDILDFLATATGEAGKREIARAFGVKGGDRIALKALLRDMADDGLIAGSRRKLTGPTCCRR